MVTCGLFQALATLPQGTKVVTHLGRGWLVPRALLDVLKRNILPRRNSYSTPSSS